jgi:PhnB protein
MAKAAKPVPDGYHTITPSLVLDNAAQTIDWYKKALGAQEVSRSVGPDGKIMHAELKIGDSRFMMNDVMMGGKGPQAFGGSPASLWLFVEDSDALYNRAVGAGAKVVMPIADQFWGDRAGSVADPAGYHWWIATRKEDLTPAEMQQRAAEFFKQMAQPAHR